MVWGLDRRGIWHLVIEERLKCSNKKVVLKDYAIVDQPDANVCSVCKSLKLPPLPESSGGVGHHRGTYAIPRGLPGLVEQEYDEV